MSREAQPHDLIAERNVLGSVLIESACIRRLMLALTATDFYRDAHRHIWRAMVSIAGDAPMVNNPPIDVGTLAAALKRDGKLDDAGGPAYLVELSTDTPTSANADYYARQVRDCALRRSLIRVGVGYESLGRDTSRPVAAALEDAESDLALVQEQAAKDLADALVGPERWAIETPRAIVASNRRRIWTGFPDIDALLRLPPGGLLVVGGSTATGKTTFALQMAEHVAASTGPVLVHSAEMHANELGLKLLVARHGLSMEAAQAVVDEDDPVFAAMTLVAEELRALPIQINDRRADLASVLRLSEMASRQKRGIALVVVDYLQLLHVSGERAESRQLEVARITRALKLWAQQSRVPVVALSQLNREADSESRPHLSHLRESGAIEQDADAVILLHSPERPVRDCPGCERSWPDKYDRERGIRLVEAFVAKQRFGAAGVRHLYADLGRSRFYGVDLEQHDAPPYRKTEAAGGNGQHDLWR